ncbi:MAG: hypothetical protein KDA85_18320, partial [Planctomycetaceae bacterium]|nr:hypothetical protein [Planctomycetaceae bacterium]
DWMPLDLLSADAIPFWMLLLIVLLCVRSSRAAWRWSGILLGALLCWQSLSHCRHLPFLALYGAYFLIPHVESCVRRFVQTGQTRLRSAGPVSLETTSLEKTAIHTRPRAKLLLPGCLSLLLALLLFPQQSVLRVGRATYPVDAMQYMADHQLSGKVLVTFNWAQYAIMVFAETSPESRVAFDGRFRTCYPQSVIDTYFDFLLGDPTRQPRYREAASGIFDPDRALIENVPDLVLVEADRIPAIQTLERHPENWVLLYQDETAQLWGHRDRERTMTSSDRAAFGDPLAAMSSHPGVAEGPESFVSWPAVPTVAMQRGGEVR